MDANEREWGEAFVDGRRFIPAGHSGFLVEPSQILCITADGNFSTLTTVDRRTIRVRQTLEGWLASLPGGAFLQTDRATIINLRHVREVDFGGLFAPVRFGVPVPALTPERNAAQRIKQALRVGR
jgi:DNA-binding LytR/AlgR family response regulator